MNRNLNDPGLFKTLNYLDRKLTKFLQKINLLYNEKTCKYGGKINSRYDFQTEMYKQGMP